MRVLRIVLLCLIVAIAGVVSLAALTATTTTVPAATGSENYSTLTTAALADYETNAANTDNVYQQQVVAGWAAKDLLSVVARQNSQMIDNQDALLAAQAAQVSNQSNVIGLMKALTVIGALGVAAIVVVGATMVGRKPTRGAPAAPAVEGGPSSSPDA